MAQTADKSSGAQQIAQAVLDVSTQALKVVLEGTTEIALNYIDDSVTAVSPTVAKSAIVPNGTLSDTIVIPAFDVSQISQLNLITNTTTTLTATTPAVAIQFSPSDTDDVWTTSVGSVTPSATANTVVTGTPVANNLYRRARVVFTDVAYTSGSFTVYANGR